MENKVVIIGGGAAGMMAAIAAADNCSEVILLEKNNKLGKKLYITGKGRCNVTNNSDVEEIISNTLGNPYFLYSSLYTFGSDSTIDFFEKNGVPLKTERGNRVFPVSDKSSDIIKALEKKLIEKKVIVKLNTSVKKINISNGKIFSVEIFGGNIIETNKIIVATGGLSYPVTGSDGDGYNFAKEVGHSVTKLHPSLVPLITDEKKIMDLQGLSLKNIGIKTFIDGKNIYEDFGEIMFTHYGLSGPLILKASRNLVGKYNKVIKISIDLKPALSEKELDARVLRDFKEVINKDFKNSLDKLLPQKIIPIIIEKSEISPYKKVNEITKDERKKLIDLLKNFEINIIGNTGYKNAVVTAGGINVKEIDPATMESKIVKGLFFAGEIIDIDSYTGGFNLQLAFSTGFLAGQSVALD